MPAATVQTESCCWHLLYCLAAVAGSERFNYGSTFDLYSGASEYQEVLSAVLNEGADMTGFDTKQLRPKDNRWDVHDVRSPATDADDTLSKRQAANLAYLWVLGWFTVDCEVDIHAFLRKTLEAASGTSSQELIKAVQGAKWVPGQPLHPSILSCFRVGMRHACICCPATLCGGRHLA